MYKSILQICSCLIALCILTLNSNFAQTSGDQFTEEENIYTKVPDIQLSSESGTFHLSDIYSQTPVIIAMVFTRCTGICSPFILQLNQHIKALNAKEKFKVLVVSFDPRDNIANMKEMSKRFRLEKDDQWIFATNQQIEALNNASSFHPIWDSATQQYDHDALLVGLNMNGYITKKLVGLRDQRALYSVIREINNDLVLAYPVPGKESFLSCFKYDPATGVRRPSYGLLILLLPAVLGVFALVLFSWRRKYYEKTHRTQ